jgi:hypothetical protein
MRTVNSDSFKQSRQGSFQTFSDLVYVHERNVPGTTLDAAVVRPMKAAPFRGLFLGDALLRANASDCTTETDANV